MQARPGTVIRLNGELLMVVKHEMKRGGRGATNVAMRLKNLIQGNTSDRCGQLPKGYPFYLWNSDDGYKNMGDWIEKAAKAVGR